jgi:hypothetical protein
MYVKSLLKALDKSLIVSNKDFECTLLMFLNLLMYFIKIIQVKTC